MLFPLFLLICTYYYYFLLPPSISITIGSNQLYFYTITKINDINKKSHFEQKNTKFTRVLTIPSRSIVARTCSDPGVTLNGVEDLIPCAMASLAMLAQRAISSYEELVQLPIKPVR